MLADYLEKFGDFEEQLKSLLQMEHYYNGRIRRKSETDRGDKESNDKVGLLKTKRLIANILNKQLKLPEAIKKL